MAIIKHYPMKSSNYNAAVDYLMFKHNEATGKILLDANGNKQLRDEYLLEGINVEPLMYAQECQALNQQYNKNLSARDVKGHHYIISFDPQDQIDHGLTLEKAQQLGMKFAKEFFPGHQMLVCTHSDGHNSSGNIHVHIMFNSLRKYDVPWRDYLKRSCDTKAGYKHQETKKYMHALKQGVMDMCRREGLHQVDLLSPAEVKINDFEYRNSLQGQRELNQLNSKIEAEGLTPMKSEYQTQKQFIRDAIDVVIANADSYEDFESELREKYGITISSSRGRLAYKHPNRDKAISGRSLGARYTTERIMELLNLKLHEFNPSFDYVRKPSSVLFIKSNLRLVVNLQTCIKAQQNAAYARKVKLSNLQQMAKTVVYVQSNNFDSIDDVNILKSDLDGRISAMNESVSKTKSELVETSKALHHLGRYYANKKFYLEMLHSGNIPEYRKHHQYEINSYEESRSYLSNHFDKESLPAISELRDRKAQLTEFHKRQSSELQALRNKSKELEIVLGNINTILSNTHMQSKAKASPEL